MSNELDETALAAMTGAEGEDELDARLTIFVDSERVTVPARIGVNAEGVTLSQVTTLDANGTLRIAAIEDEPLEQVTVGDFFNTWQTSAGQAGNNADAILDQDQLLGNFVDSNSTIQMFVDGQISTELQNYVIENGDEIILVFGANPVVSLNTNFGPIAMELFEQRTPGTVENFLNYVNDGDYLDSIFHRSDPDFVIQGGGFTTTSTTFTSTEQFTRVPTDLPIANEPGISNLRGTVAMAKIGMDPDSATSQFFVNLDDSNASLDLPQNNSFTVFAQVLDMTTVDAIERLPVDMSNPSPFGELPLSVENELVVIQSIEGQGSLTGVKFLDENANGVRDAGETGVAGITVFLDENDNGVLNVSELSTVTDSEGRFLLQADPGAYVVRAEVSPERQATLPVGADKYEVTVEIGRTLSDLDFGEVAVNTPSPPSGVDLVAGSDSGVSSEDDRTNLNNSTSDTALEFDVAGVSSGAEVRIYRDNVPIGQATAAGDTVTVTTDGVTGFTDGVYDITATQVVEGIESPASDILSIMIDTTPPAAITNTAPDTARVGVEYTFDAESPEEGETGVAYSVLDAPEGMTIDSQSGVITWTPSANQVASQSFEISVTDDVGNSTVQRFDITVLDTPPELPAAPDEYTVDEDSPLVVGANEGVLANDGDANSGELSMMVVTNPDHGTLEASLDGSFTYTPEADYFGSDSFTYKAIDDDLESTFVLVSIEVLPINDPVVAEDDSYTAERNAPLTVDAEAGVLANDTDVDGDTLTSSIAADASNGVVTLNSDGSFVYTPEANFSGTDTFSYTVQDGNGQEDTASVTITVTDSGSAGLSGFVYIDANGDDERDADEVGVPGVLITLSGTNDAGDSVSRTAITLNDGSYQFSGLPLGTYQLTESQPNSLMNGSAEDVFTELEVTSEQNSAGHDFAEASLRPAYVSIAWFFASVSSPNEVFREMVALAEEKAGNSDLAKAIREGAPGLPDDVNSPPVAVADFYAADGDRTLNVDAADGVLANDLDVDDDTLTAMQVGPADHGTVELNPDGSFTYMPDIGFTGTDAFTYTASDGVSVSNEATVRVTVRDTTNTFSIDENSPAGTFVGTVTPNTEFDDPRIHQFADATLSQDLKLAADDHLSGDPAAPVVLIEYLDFQCPICRDFHPSVKALEDEFDGELLVVRRHLPLTEVHPNAFAAARAAEAAGRQGMFEEMGDLLFENQDEWESETDPQPFFDEYAVELGLNLSQFVEDLADPTIDQRITRDSEAADRLGATGTPTFFLSGEALEGPQPEDLSGLVQTEVDQVNEPFLLDRTTGDLSVSGRRDLDFERDSSFSFSIEVSDLVGGFELLGTTVEVLDVNELPEAVSDSYSVLQDDTLDVDEANGLLANDIDEDGDLLTASLVAGTTRGELTLNEDGSFEYTPNTGFTGTDTFTYRVSDGSLQSDTATVVITVNDVNVAPVAVSDVFEVDQDQELEVDAPGVLAGDTDADGDTLTASLVDQPSDGGLEFNPDGSFIYTPEPGFIGTDSFTYQANDGLLSSEIATVTISVNEVNTAPEAASDTYLVLEDNVLEVSTGDGVLQNDTDADGDILTAVVVNLPTTGVLTLNTDGSFSYTPDANFHGTAGFSYQASDGRLSSDPVSVVITVEPVNDPPFADGDLYEVDEDQTLEVDAAAGLLANDTDPEDDPLTAALLAPPDHGEILSLNPDGSFTYVPDAEFSGTDTFIYEVTDGELVAQGSATITVNPVNDFAPSAQSDFYDVAVDGELVVTSSQSVLLNDSDGDGDMLTAVLVSNPANGALELAADGSFTYTPNSGFRGIDQFEYTASDGENISGEASVTITVNATPVVADDTYEVDTDGMLDIAVPGVLGNDSDVDGDVLVATLATDVSNGTLTLDDDGSFTYLPAPNFQGIDSFTYTASDELADSVPATVTITVGSPNQAPVAQDDSFAVAIGESLEIGPAGGVLANDTDADGDALTAIRKSDVAHGALTFNDDGSFIYTPADGFDGPDSFTYAASDGLTESVPATVTITVQPANSGPIAENDTFNVPVDGALTIDSAGGVLANDVDVDNDSLTVSLETDAAHGTLMLNEDGSFTYQPTDGFQGVDSFTYLLSDGDLTDEAVATIFVNSRPMATNDQYEVGEGMTLQVDAPSGVLANDSDADGDPLTITIRQSPFNGDLELNPDGSFSYTPDAGFDGTDAFTYTINDGLQDSELAAALIVTLAANEPPQATEDAYAVDQGDVLDVSESAGVLANDMDADGDALTARLIQSPAVGNIKFNSDGSFMYGAGLDFSGAITFTYIANDGTDDSAETTVTVTVIPVEGEAESSDVLDQVLANEADWLNP